MSGWQQVSGRQTGRGHGAGRSQGALIYLWLSALVIGLDQLSKAVIMRSIGLGQSLKVLPVLDITHVYNRGAAFSFLDRASGWQRWMFTILALLVSAVLLLWLRRIDRRERVLASAVALILGGAIGNLIDRLRLGYVVDFINAHWGPHYFPTFNTADSAITVGAVLLLLDAWLEAR